MGLGVSQKYPKSLGPERAPPKQHKVRSFPAYPRSLRTGNKLWVEHKKIQWGPTFLLPDSAKESPLNSPHILEWLEEHGGPDKPELYYGFNWYPGNSGKFDCHADVAFCRLVYGQLNKYADCEYYLSDAFYTQKMLTGRGPKWSENYFLVFKFKHCDIVSMSGLDIWGTDEFFDAESGWTYNPSGTRTGRISSKTGMLTSVPRKLPESAKTQAATKRRGGTKTRLRSER